MRVITPEDAKAFFVFMQQNRAFFDRWIEFRQRLETIEEVEEMLEKNFSGYQAGEKIRCGLWRGNSLIANVSLNDIDSQSHNASLGFYLAELEQGRGLATNACSVLLKHGFKGLGLHRVYAECVPNNTSSIAVVQRLGFKLEGVCREAYYLNGEYVDVNLYSMLDREWSGD